MFVEKDKHVDVIWGQTRPLPGDRQSSRQKQPRCQDAQTSIRANLASPGNLIPFFVVSFYQSGDGTS